MNTVEIGGSTYDVYADIADANLYLDGALHAGAWHGTTTNDEQKARALVTATRTLDRQNWKGSKAVPTQPLDFPRTDMGITPEPVVDEFGVPIDIVHACIELAVGLADGTMASVQNDSSTATRIRSMSAGSVNITFFRNPDGTAARFPTIIQELIGKYLGGGVSGFFNKAVGVDAKSMTANLDLGFSSGIQ